MYFTSSFLSVPAALWRRFHKVVGVGEKISTFATGLVAFPTGCLFRYGISRQDAPFKSRTGCGLPRCIDEFKRAVREGPLPIKVEWPRIGGGREEGQPLAEQNRQEKKLKPIDGAKGPKCLDRARSAQQMNVAG